MGVPVHWGRHILLDFSPLVLGEQGLSIAGIQSSCFCVMCTYECISLKAVVLAPLFLVSLGVVLFLNGLQLYAFFLTNSSDEGSAIGSLGNSTDVNIFCMDVRASGQNEIFGEERYVLIEFVGALVSVLFFVSPIATR